MSGITTTPFSRNALSPSNVAGPLAPSEITGALIKLASLASIAFSNAHGQSTSTSNAQKSSNVKRFVFGNVWNLTFLSLHS